MQSKLLDVFPEEKLKELREAEVTVLLEDVGKAEVSSLTQSELSDTVEEVKTVKPLMKQRVVSSKV